MNRILAKKLLLYFFNVVSVTGAVLIILLLFRLNIKIDKQISENRSNFDAAVASIEEDHDKQDERTTCLFNVFVSFIKDRDVDAVDTDRCKALRDPTVFTDPTQPTSVNSTAPSVNFTPSTGTVPTTGGSGNTNTPANQGPVATGPPDDPEDNTNTDDRNIIEVLTDPVINLVDDLGHRLLGR